MSKQRKTFSLDPVNDNNLNGTQSKEEASRKANVENVSSE
jgi:hypothetical protein